MYDNNTSNELDDWMRSAVLPLVGDNTDDLITIAAWQLLDRYIERRPVGDECSFSLAIMRFCSWASSDFAERTASDPACDPSPRFEAATLSIQLSDNLLRDDPGRQIVKDLLVISPRDQDERYFKRLFVEQAVISDPVWFGNKMEIRRAVAELAVQHRIVNLRPLATRASCRAALDRMKYART